MRYIVGLFILFFIVAYCSQKHDMENPYSEGAHWDYHITCENGFVYKHISKKGTIQVLNSDGTPLKCGKKIY
jgi:hypothetical protein